MQLMTAKQARNQFGELMNAMQREPVFITKNNKPVGAFVSIEDLKGTYIAEAFEEPSAEYETWITEKLTDSFNQFKENGSQGVSMAEAKELIRQRFNERLTTKK